MLQMYLLGEIYGFGYAVRHCPATSAYMKNRFLVPDRKIQQTGLIAKAIAYSRFHVGSTVITFIKIDMELGCIQDIFVHG